MDISATIVPKSDQINADDPILDDPKTFTISDVKKGLSAEQPVDIILAELGADKVYRPSLGMRRVIVAAWGPDSAKYAGRRLTLYRDPSVKFGRDLVGGIRISHLSGIDSKTLTIPLAVSKGKRVPFTVSRLDNLSPQTEQPQAPVRPVTEPAAAHMLSLLARLGARGGKSAPEFIRDVIGRRVEGPQELTEEELSAVIAAAELIEVPEVG